MMYMNKMNINCNHCNSPYVHKSGKQEVKKIGVSSKYSQFIYTCLSCQKNFSTKNTKYLSNGEKDEDYSKSEIYNN